MTSRSAYGGPLSGHTQWRDRVTPLHRFLHTETGGAIVLLAAALIALAWVNIDAHSYDAVWDTELAITVGDASLSQTAREWINSGLMALFFFVVGLEARREFDLGELRDRRRLALPLLAGFGGMLLPVAIYLVINAGESSVHGWGMAMSTDTAFALGMLALVGRDLPTRLRVFLLTVTVVDDIIALLVIATAYSGSVATTPLFVGLGIFAAIMVVRAFKVRVELVYFVLAGATWVAVIPVRRRPHRRGSRDGLDDVRLSGGTR